MVSASHRSLSSRRAPSNTLGRFYLLVGLISISGCMPSIAPLHSPEVEIQDDRVLGEWVNAERAPTKPVQDEDLLTVKKKDKHYQFDLLTPNKKPGSYDVHFVRLGKETYFDLSSPYEEFDSNGRLTFPMHLIYRVTLADDTFESSPLDGAAVKSLVEKDQGNVRVLRIAILGDEKIEVLSCSTQELQEFIKKHGTALFGTPQKMKRVKLEKAKGS